MRDGNSGMITGQRLHRIELLMLLCVTYITYFIIWVGKRVFLISYCLIVEGIGE